uniref:Histone H1 n=1 Tax=Anthurium amnicola TaxID=1678845 RepID=A0A1D1YEP0_9ARAE
MARGSPAKSKKQASPPSHPKYEDMIRDAIVALKERKGSSRQAIKKYIISTYKLPDNVTTNNRLKLAITKGVDKGTFSFFNGPSGTLKLVKKETPKKEKKEVEKKEKPKKAEKKEAKPKAEKKTTTRKAPTRKPAATTKKAPAKKKTSTSTKKTRTSATSKKASEKRAGTRRKAASS